MMMMIACCSQKHVAWTLLSRARANGAYFQVTAAITVQLISNPTPSPWRLK